MSSSDSSQSEPTSTDRLAQDPIPKSHVALVSRLMDERSNSLVFYASQWTDEPEDCVQEALVQLAIQKVLPDSPVAWLYRVVKNRALNRARGQRRRRDREHMAWQLRLADQPNHNRSGDGGEAEPGERIDLIDALARLDGEAREVVMLHVEAGMSFAMIGKVLDMSASSAHRRYYLALKKLQRQLNPTPSLNIKDNFDDDQ